MGKVQVGALPVGVIYLLDSDLQISIDAYNSSLFSFFFLVIFQQHFETSSIPCLFVASKSDMHPVRQNYTLQPAQFCASHNLPAPQTYSSKGRPNKDIYIKLATLAAYP